MLTTVIINDCRDANAMGRQMTRVASLLGSQVIPVGVQDDLEAAGCLVDALDALGGRGETLVLLNVAPRNGPAKKWPNGSPFGYFYYCHTLVISSIDGLALSLAKKMGWLTQVRLLDIPTVVEKMVAQGAIDEADAGLIENSQFRSFDILPYAASYLKNSLLGLTRFGKFPLKEIPDPPKAVWYIDCFGNAKTTLLLEDVKLSDNGVIELKIGPFLYYPRLADVPDDGMAAMVTGSSGIRSKRFLEIVVRGVQGGGAAEKLGLEVGQIIL